MDIKMKDEDQYRDTMPNVPLPQYGMIQQTDENGCQIPVTEQKSSWFATLCNCFKAIDRNYSLQKDQVLLEPQSTKDSGKNTLVLDLDETLVHSSFSATNADILLDLTIEWQKFKIFVLKRPGVENFLSKCCELFEVVIFTASLSIYADPLINILDPHRRISFRLFRESCSFANGTYVKDLSRLGRDLKKVIIVDNSPTSYSFQPDNAVPIKTWLDDKSDRELDSIWEVLKVLADCDNIPEVLKTIKENKLEMSPDSVEKVADIERALFNSPTHANGDKRFTFDD